MHRRTIPVELAGLYWHLVDVIWIFLYPVLYLARWEIMVSIRSMMIIVWLMLMLLLAATVAASFVAVGAANVAVSLGIAFCKAALVFWFFMNLRAENGLIRIAALGAVIWLLLLLLLSGTDFATRSGPMISQ